MAADITPRADNLILDPGSLPGMTRFFMSQRAAGLSPWITAEDQQAATHHWSGMQYRWPIGSFERSNSHVSNAPPDR